MKRGKLGKYFKVFSFFGREKKKKLQERAAQIPPESSPNMVRGLRRANGNQISLVRSSQAVLNASAVKRQSNVISTGFQDRLKERKKAEKTRIAKQIGIFCGVILFSLTLIWVLLFSSLLAYQTGKTKIIGVSGEVDKAAINSLLNSYQGTPLLRISTATLETEIAKTSTWIDKVEVNRAFPHGLEIKITAAQPVAVYGKTQLLSKSGSILNAKNIPPNLPQVASYCGADRNDKCLKFTIQVMSLLPPDLVKNLSNIEISPSASLELYFSDKKHVIWGTDEHNQEKLKILKIIIKEPGRIYDLSTYSTPSIKQ